MSTIYGTDGNVYETGIRGTTNSENELIIEQLNKFGRVPQTFELLQMIKQLEQENKQLKDNWNDLKQDIGYELLKLREPSEYNKGLCNAFNYINNKIYELEQGSDNNE